MMQSTRAIIRQSTFANLPAASSATGMHFIVTDLNYNVFVSNGSIWRPINGLCVLAQSGVAQTVGAVTTEVTLATYNVPAGLMTANGSLIVECLTENNNNANNKTWRIYLGSTKFQEVINTTNVTTYWHKEIFNRNSQSSQVGMNLNTVGYSVGASSLTTGTVDTSAATTLTITAQKAVAGDTATLGAYKIILSIP